MHLVFDIFQGIGVAAAVGIRPFLPTLAVGALAAGDVGIDFTHTDFSFLQSAPFLLAIVVGAALVALAERRFGADRLHQPPVGLTLAAIALGLGALEFAGSLCRGDYAIWPGLIGGAVCALVGIAATRPLLARVRARLDQAAAAALPLFAETAAVVIAALSIVAPPAGPVALAFLLWMALAGRRRDGGKFAGLRILR